MRGPETWEIVSTQLMLGLTSSYVTGSLRMSRPGGRQHGDWDHVCARRTGDSAVTEQRWEPARGLRVGQGPGLGPVAPGTFSGALRAARQ